MTSNIEATLQKVNAELDKIINVNNNTKTNRTKSGLPYPIHLSRADANSLVDRVSRLRDHLPSREFWSLDQKLKDGHSHDGSDGSGVWRRATQKARELYNHHEAEIGKIRAQAAGKEKDEKEKQHTAGTKKWDLDDLGREPDLYSLSYIEKPLDAATRKPAEGFQPEDMSVLLIMGEREEYDETQDTSQGTDGYDFNTGITTYHYAVVMLNDGRFAYLTINIDGNNEWSDVAGQTYVSDFLEEIVRIMDPQEQQQFKPYVKYWTSGNKIDVLRDAVLDQDQKQIDAIRLSESKWSMKRIMGSWRQFRKI